MERQESIIPWKKRSPSPVEEESEHSSKEEEDQVELMGGNYSSREASFERNDQPVTLVTAKTNDTIVTPAAPMEAISKGKVELLERYKKTHEA